jgi:TRAP-type C4-dicarboxylate transport system substrate-binding protein
VRCGFSTASRSAMLKGVQLGTIDLAFITGAPLPNIIPDVGIFNIPF